ncbi:MAG TPA: AgmX/PglI C-terminal domain-containing protein [Gemmatimonadaceae bacterium]|nr:AgmX/PglI C-terminal domain-containing protein [Gemmatimonadaceae bacterium]
MRRPLAFASAMLGVALAACAQSSRATPPSPSPAPRDTTTRPPAVAVAVTAATPTVRPDAPTGDTAVVDNVVRRRRAELQTCYEQEGLKVNPDLAGNVVLAISVAPLGTVSGVTIPERSWSGPGATETESCMQNKVKAWRFPEMAGGGGTFEFSFNFSR